MAYTAFKHAAWNPVHSIEIHWATLHGIHCIQSGSIGPSCMQSTAFTLDAFHTAAWNPVHSVTLHGIHSIESVSITSCGIEYISIIEIHCTTLHRIHCIQSHCMESTPFNRDPLGHTAWNPLHSLGIHFTTLHGNHSIES